MLIDTHCHLQSLDISQEGLMEVLQRAADNDVAGMLCVCITLDDMNDIVAIINQHSHIYGSVGIHPNSDIAEIKKFVNLQKYLQHQKIIAIGETGLDYFRSTENKQLQRDLFAQHIETAKEFNRPLIIHSRAAKQDTISILKEYHADTVGGIMHCFVEDIDMAKKCLDLNFYISFSGIVTFKNAGQIQEVAKYVPLDRMLIETDSPYLAPVPHRGKSNEPAWVKYVALKIAELRNMPYEKIAAITTANYYKLFHNYISP